jgi:hypothetical protein
MYTTLTTIKNYLEQKFRQQKSSLGWEVQLGPIEKEGQVEKSLFITLVRSEEETSVKQPNAQLRTNAEGNKHYYVNPDVCLNLYILISSHAEYGLALQQINDTIYYLNSIYHYQEDSNISDEIKKLSIELQSPTAEQWNSMWQTLGGKVVPSVLYKVRMITISAISSNKEAKLVEEVIVDEKSPLRYKNEEGIEMNDEEQEELLRVLEDIRKKDAPHLSVQELRFLFKKEVTLDKNEQGSLFEGLKDLRKKGNTVFTVNELQLMQKNGIVLTEEELDYIEQNKD